MFKRILCMILPALLIAAPMYSTTSESSATVATVETQTITDQTSKETNLVKNIREVIGLAVVDSFQAHLAELGLESADPVLVDLECYTVNQLWISHLGGVAFTVKTHIEESGLKFLQDYIGPDHTDLFPKLSKTISDLHFYLKCLILESIDSLDCKLEEDKKDEIASIMANEIVAFSLYRFQQTLEGPSTLQLAAHHGLKALQKQIVETEKLRKQLGILSKSQNQTLANLKRAYKATKDVQEKEALLKKINQFNAYSIYINTYYRTVTAQIYTYNTLYWMATSRWTKPVRYLMKKSAQLCGINPNQMLVSQPVS